MSKNVTMNNINNTTPAKKVIKEGDINLTGKELDENKIRVLNLVPKFVSTNMRQRPYMDMIQITKICAIGLNNDRHFEKAENCGKVLATYY